jgi:hypothetical protein
MKRWKWWLLNEDVMVGVGLLTLLVAVLWKGCQ